MIIKSIAALLTLSLVLCLTHGLTLTASAESNDPELSDLTVNGFFTAHTPGIKITDKAVTVKFTAKATIANTSSPVVFYRTPNAFVFHNSKNAGKVEPKTEQYKEYQLLRLDNDGWGGNNSTRGAAFARDFVWESTYLPAINNGTEIVVSAVRLENTVYIVLSGAGITNYATVTVEEGKDAYLGISGEECEFKNFTLTRNTEVDAASTIYCLGDGQTHTEGTKITEAGIDITFNAKTYDMPSVNCNWYTPKYILYTGSTTYATGNDYWVERSDLWGDAGSGLLAFKEHSGPITPNTPDAMAAVGVSHVVDAPVSDWATWLNGMKAGAACKITAWRDGNNVIVKYTANGAASTVTVPFPAETDAYICLTGTVTQLTNLSVNAHTHTPAEPSENCRDSILCTICGQVAIAGSTGHNFTKYTADRNVITQSCANEGCKVFAGTATITAPTSPVDDGTTEHKATVTYSDGWKGGELDITYSPSAPVAAGEYTASITCGEAKASVSYEVSNHTHAYIYALNSDRTVITETCTVAGCDHEKTATISAPTGTLTADGTTEFAANVVYEEGWAGKKPAIAYTVDTVATTDLTKGGAYEASITVDGMKAHVTYNVHAHNYIYAASSNKITQTCSCGHSATATVNAPTGTLYAGSNHNATVTCDSKWVGEKPTVTHTLGGKTVTATNVVGKYTASITVGDKTASVNFEVIERPADTLPDLDGTGWWTAHTEGVKITEAGVEITFTNTTYATATGNWNGPLWILYHNSVASVGGDNYAEYWVERGDLYGWAGAALKTYKNFTGDVDTGDNAANLTSVGVTHEVTANVTDWAAWLTEMKAGADCKIVAKRDGANIVVTFVANDAATKVTVPFPADQDAYISLTAELAKLTNIKVVALESDNTGDTYTGDTGPGETGTGDTDTGDTGTGDTDTGNTDSGNTDSGDTGNNGPTVTPLPDVDSPAFWGSHSAGQEITADGFDITFTSTSYADISNNWEGPMYILFAGDEPKVNGAGYTELWVQRGDNYGWIDGKNNLDHMADLNALGITYESSCADWDALWADYVANLKKGCEVKIHAELKDGKAVVTMTVQGLTMTTSVPVPEGKTVYLAVSGEKTKLTDINVKTGDPIAVVFALMVASAAGIVVLKKKKEF